jgi:hypothetical protein
VLKITQRFFFKEKRKREEEVALEKLKNIWRLTGTKLSWLALSWKSMDFKLV